MFPTFIAIAKLVKRLSNRAEQSQTKADIDHDLRTDKLIEALYNCGIPRWIAVRNAKAFMCLRPEFDLDSPKHRRLKNLLEHHQQEFWDAYLAIASTQGHSKAEEWMSYIRGNDVFFARIVSLPDGFDSKYLFAC